jgi:nucleoside-diphosphate-sugar epimerase
VGGYLRRALVARGQRVVGLDLPGSGAEIEQDLGDPAFDAGAAGALADQTAPVGGIIHCAARITRGSSVDLTARRNLRAIAEACVLLAEAWRSRQPSLHIVLCSTLKVYGAVPVPIDPVSSPLRPEPKSYGSAKALAERLLAVSARRAGYTYAIVRPTYVYGPGQHPANAIPTFLRAAWAGEAPVIFGESGRELRDDVYVADVATWIAEACLRRAEGPFNAAGEKARPLVEVATLCCQVVAALGGPADLVPRLDPSRKPKPWIDQSFDGHRTWDLLGSPPTPFLDGLRQAAAALRPRAGR